MMHLYSLACSFSACPCFSFFLFTHTATTEIYTLSLHDALPIYSHSHRQPVKAFFQNSERTDLLAQNGCKSVLSEFWKKDRKSTRLNSSHTVISYAVFCLKKKKNLYRS